MLCALRIVRIEIEDVYLFARLPGQRKDIARREAFADNTFLCPRLDRILEGSSFMSSAKLVATINLFTMRRAKDRGAAAVCVGGS